MHLSLHHVGIAVKNIPAATTAYIKRFGFEIRSEIIHDPAQTALVQFLRLPGDSIFLEFVAPDGENSKLTQALKKGGGLNHLCFATEDIEGTCATLRAVGLHLLQAPIPATAFPGRRIAWLIAADGIPIELVEREDPDRP